MKDKTVRKRAILLDSTLLVNESTKDYAFFLADVIEYCGTMEYCDLIVLDTSFDKAKLKRQLKNWCINPDKIIYPYADFDKLKETYRFLLLICSKRNRTMMRNYYKCNLLVG